MLIFASYTNNLKMITIKNIMDFNICFSVEIMVIVVKKLIIICRQINIWILNVHRFEFVCSCIADCYKNNGNNKNQGNKIYKILKKV